MASIDPASLRAEFYALPLEAMVDRPTAAAVRYVSTATLEAEAIKGAGPTFTRVGRRALYKKADLMAWLAGKVEAGGHLKHAEAA